jgi:hypothetical protein
MFKKYRNKGMDDALNQLHLSDPIRVHMDRNYPLSPWRRLSKSLKRNPISIENKRKEIIAKRQEGDNLIDDNRHRLNTKSFEEKWAKHLEEVEELLLQMYDLERKETIKKYTLRSLYILTFTGTIALLFIV